MSAFILGLWDRQEELDVSKCEEWEFASRFYRPGCEPGFHKEVFRRLPISAGIASGVKFV